MTAHRWFNPRVGALLAVLCMLGASGCGPEVHIITPADGEVLTTSSVLARIEYTAAARTVEIAIDGSDVLSSFFFTDEGGAGLISGLTSGDHFMQVAYTSTNGFQDTDEVLFSVALDVSLSSLSVTPSPVSVAVGASAQLSVTGELSDGTTRDLTGASNTAYGSADESIATVSSDGLVTGVAEGSTTIGVQNGSAAGAVPVTVSAAASAG